MSEEEETAIITADTCPHCDGIKKFIQENGLTDKVKMINASTPEGLDFARKHGITAVPECAIIDGKGNVRKCTDEEFSKVLKR